MKTKQEQIEQMITIFKNNREVCQHTRCVECKYHVDEDCMYSSCAYSLYQAGYGDVSEYKSEIERSKKETSDTRKGIAKEILQILYDKCYEINDETGESMGNFVSDDDILYLAKHYGVEVKI